MGFLYKHPLCCWQDRAEFPGTWKQLPELVGGLGALLSSLLQQLQQPEALTQGKEAEGRDPCERTGGPLQTESSQGSCNRDFIIVGVGRICPGLETIARV